MKAAARPVPRPAAQRVRVGRGAARAARRGVSGSGGTSRKVAAAVSEGHCLSLRSSFFRANKLHIRSTLHPHQDDPDPTSDLPPALHVLPPRRPTSPPLRPAPHLSRPPPPFRTPPTHDSAPLPSPCSLFKSRRAPRQPLAARRSPHSLHTSLHRSRAAWNRPGQDLWRRYSSTAAGGAAARHSASHWAPAVRRSRTRARCPRAARSRLRPPFSSVNAVASRRRRTGSASSPHGP